jgi:uncharacterized protein YcgI (DUF1989 family)
MKLLEDVVISRNTGRAFTLRKGQSIRIIGESIVDFVAFNLDNLKERFDQGRTKANQSKIFLSSGDKLMSKSNNVMLTIVEDTYEGTHDLEYGMCSRGSYRYYWKNQCGLYPALRKHGISKEEDLPDHGCWENLSEALQPYNIAPEDIPSPFNIFQTMQIDGRTGRMEVGQRPKPGTYVQLRAEMDCLVGISACPEGGMGKALRVQVYEE